MTAGQVLRRLVVEGLHILIGAVAIFALTPLVGIPLYVAIWIGRLMERALRPRLPDRHTERIESS